MQRRCVLRGGSPVCQSVSKNRTHLRSKDYVPVKVLLVEQLLECWDDEETAGDLERSVGRQKVILDVDNEESCL